MWFHRVTHTLDLAQVPDEDLVSLAQLDARHPAARVLLTRLYGWTQRLIGQYARRTGLRPDDREDAQQEAVFAILEALGAYDVSRPASPRPCCFRTFLAHVVTARFRNFLKRLRRTQTRYGRATQAALEAPSAGGRKAPDPCQVVLAAEAALQLRRAVEGLSPPERALWDGLAAGVPLRALARDLGLSYEAAKRLRRRVLGRLRCRLQGRPD
jgi:RNA polymerase sigma factor (sigma-70 family)